jgi:hypothetical protein
MKRRRSRYYYQPGKRNPPKHLDLTGIFNFVKSFNLADGTPVQVYLPGVFDLKVAKARCEVFGDRVEAVPELPGVYWHHCSVWRNKPPPPVAHTIWVPDTRRAADRRKLAEAAWALRILQQDS